MAMSVHLTNCMLPQHKSENFQNDKMNKSIQLVRPNDGLYNPYEMTKWNSRWQCLSIWPIVCCISTNQKFFQMTKWTNRFSWSDQMTDCTIRTKWQTEIADGNVCPSDQLYAVSAQNQKFFKSQNEQTWATPISFFWPTESICSFCHLEKFLICAETAYNWSGGQTLPSAISFCHFVRMVQSVIWSDQMNRFVHFVIWKIFWFVLRQHTIGQMYRHCHPLFHFVNSYGLYNPSFGLTNWIDLFILSFGKISDLCWDSIQLVRWMDIAIRYFILSFRTDCTIRHLVWPTESICSFCHFEKFLICAETAYNWSDGQTFPSPISFRLFVRFVQSVIWSDQMNRFVDLYNLYNITVRISGVPLIRRGEWADGGANGQPYVW